MARVWIYQADRFLTDAEVEHIAQEANEFMRSWTAHGTALAGRVSVEHNLFLLLLVDEEQALATGCSIDKSVHFVQALGQRYGIDFFNRMNTAYRSNVDDSLQLATREEFAQRLKEGIVNQETLVYNNLIQDSSELSTKWEVPFAVSWHSKVF